MKFDLCFEQTDEEGLELYHGLLLIEADPVLGASFVKAFREAGLQAWHYTDPDAALAYWAENTGLVAVLDEEFLYRHGSFFASPLYDRNPERGFPYVVITGSPDYKRAVSYLKMGALDYLVKDPTLPDYLTGLMQKLLSRLNGQVELRRSQQALLKNELELRSITDNIEDVLIKTDLTLSCTYVSPAVKRVLKTHGTGLMQVPLPELAHADDAGTVGERLQEVIASGQSCKLEFRVRSEQGGYLWAEACGTPLRDETGAITGVILTLRDVTHRRMIDRQLAEERNFSNTILETVGSLIAVLTPEGRIVRFNRACVELTGISADQAENILFWELIDGIPDQLQFQALLQQVLRDARSTEFETRMGARAGDVRTVQMVLSRLPSESAQGGYVVCTGLDITNRKRIEEEIRYMSFHDSLTGLYNRLYFEEELNRLDTARQLPLSIIVGDVNGLKLINDAFGHEAGDQLIQAAAEVLKRTCRTDDIIARIGGDEFGILLPGTPEESALEIATRIREKSRDIVHEPIQVSIAVGVAAKREPQEDIRAVFKAADDRMYKNKLVESKSLKSAIITSLRKTLRERTIEMGEHSERLKDLSLRLGRRLGFSASQLDDLELLALLHDIGKIAVPDCILQKAAPLTAEEWDVMRQHPEIGYRIASTTPELANIAEYILSHHEWFDGSGYPQGLMGEDIPVISRALSVADAFDAMISARRYRPSRSCQEALRELERYAGRQFDTCIVREFIEMILEEKPHQVC